MSTNANADITFHSEHEDADISDGQFFRRGRNGGFAVCDSLAPLLDLDGSADEVAGEPGYEPTVLLQIGEGEDAYTVRAGYAAK